MFACPPARARFDGIWASVSGSSSVNCKPGPYMGCVENGLLVAASDAASARACFLEVAAACARAKT